MRVRFLSNLLILVIGGWLMADRFLFGHTAGRWIAFGAGSAIVVVCALAFLARDQGLLQRLIDVYALIVGAWMVVASLTYSLHTVGWIGVGAGGGAAASGLVGLVAHELFTERALAGAVAVSPSEESDADGAGPANGVLDGDTRDHDGDPTPLAIGSWRR